MSWRIILITKPCNLLFKNNQLLYQPVDDEELQVPLEDINSIILDTQQVNISGYLLAKIAENKISLLTTDFSHIPNGIFLPYMSYYKNYETAILQQQQWTDSFKKKLWQKIIIQKIRNQAFVIKQSNPIVYNRLIKLSENVLLGDKFNIEARAASEYWKAYEENFIRHSNTKINVALNYGYSIIRSILAKNITAIGFIACFGIYHKNQYNSFNLVDDLIEPFRPFIDFKIKELFNEDSKNFNLTINEKQEIIKIMFYEIKFNNEKYSIMYAAQLVSENLLKVTKTKDIKNFFLPTFVEE